MTSFGLVKFKLIERMLRRCAEGFTIEAKKHRYWVRWKGRTYRALPQGQHGKKTEIEIGHIRAMVRHLQIDLDCAKREIPALA